MEKLKSVYFDGLAHKRHLIEFFKSFHPELKAFITENRETMLSGLQCFLTAYYLEQDQKYDESLLVYTQGVEEFMDPLCAYRLAQINLMNLGHFKVHVDKYKALYYLSISSFTQLCYGVSFSSHEILKFLIHEVDKKQPMYSQFVETTCQMKGFGETLAHLIQYEMDKVGYPETIDQIISALQWHTDSELLQALLLQLLLRIMISEARTDDKQIEKIINFMESSSPLQSIAIVTQRLKRDIQILGFKIVDNETCFNQRQFFFECHYLVKNILKISTNQKKFDKISEFIKVSKSCGDIWDNLIICGEKLHQMIPKIDKTTHVGMIIRIYSKMIVKGNPYTNTKPDVERGYELQLTELSQKKDSLYSYALAYYSLSKIAYKSGKLEEAQTNMDKSIQLYTERITKSDNLHVSLISNYYLSRLFHFNGKNAHEKSCLDECMKLITKNDLLKQVKTLQYHIIQRKVENRLNLIYKAMQQEIEEQERRVSDHREVSQSFLRILSQSSIEAKQFVNRKDHRLSTGPLVTQKLETNHCHAETAISLYSSKVQLCQQASVERKELKFKENAGLNFIRGEDIQMRELIQKGQLDGGASIIMIDGKRYCMKYLTFIKKIYLETTLEICKYQLSFSHPRLRKSLAYVIEPLSQIYTNLGFIYELAQQNLYYLEKQRGKFKEKQLIQIALDVVEPIHYLHQQQYFHGNLKPSNILLQIVKDQIYALVADWEFTKAIYPMIYDEPNILFGWTAPEIYREEAQLSSDSDKWSLGALLLFIFYGVNIQRLDDPYRFLVLPTDSTHDPNLKIMIEGLCRNDPASRLPLEDVIQLLEKLL